MAPVSAAPRQKTPPTYGIDISYPQCGRQIPTDQAFGIVGVNGGKASNFNPCLREQLIWASKSSPAVPEQDNIQLYVNTGNPGQVQNLMDDPSSWPTSTSPTNPYKEIPCTALRESNQACSWEYGYSKAKSAVSHFIANIPEGISNDPKSYVWWLDVEQANSWQGDSREGGPIEEEFENNVAALVGWTQYFKENQISKVGVYSTSYQWGQITGNLIQGTNLVNLPTWYALGRTSVSTAAGACSHENKRFTGGPILLTQYVSKNLDYNYSCPAASDPGVWNSPVFEP